MQGLMMDRQLLISSLIEHGAKVYHDREIVSRTVEGPIHRYTFADLHGRSNRWPAPSPHSGSRRRIGSRR